jgi:hypothetical protein
VIVELLKLKLEHHQTIKQRLKCRRCELRYDKSLKECPYCSHLDEKGFKALLDDQERIYKSRRELGIWFLFASSLICAALLLCY